MSPSPLYNLDLNFGDCIFKLLISNQTTEVLSALVLCLSANSNWWMLLPGEAGGEPLQHISISETPGEELVRSSEKERKT